MKRLVLCLLVTAMLASGCTISVTINPTEAPAPTQLPRPAATARPPRPTGTAHVQESHELYAGLTGDEAVPFLALHPDGERLGVGDYDFSTGQRSVVWQPRGGGGIVIFSSSNGYPKSAIVGSYVLLFSNYSASSVDITVIHPDGRRETVHSTLYGANGAAFAAKTPGMASMGSAFGMNGLFQQQGFWGYLEEGLFGLEIVGCTGAGAAFAPTIVGLAALGVACKGPLLELAIRERKVENLDVGQLEQAQEFMTLYGCYTGNAIDCVNKLVGDMAERERAAAERAASPPQAPTAVPTKCKSRYNCN